jgi:hypothetical protein
MHRGGNAMGLEAGGKGNGMGRHGYRRDGYRPPDRPNGFMERGGAGTGGTAENSMHKGSYDPRSPTTRGTNGIHNGDTTSIHGGAINTATPQAAISDLEKRVSGVQQDFTEALHKISAKENEKFDLIFAILSELQSRQAQLEESVRSLKAQYGGAGPAAGSPSLNGVNGGSTGPTAGGMAAQQQAQLNQNGHNAGANYAAANSNGHQAYGPMGGQMNGQMGNNLNGNQSMQQFQGVMQADGSQAMFTAVPQVVVVSSPTAAGMQYAVPQNLMAVSPTGAMQPMHPQMAMQFMAGQNTGQDMNGFGVSGGAQEAASGGTTGTNGAQPQVQQQGTTPEGAAGAPRNGQSLPQQVEKESDVGA